MKQFLIRFLRLIFGLFVYSVGIVVTINAHIGYAPWDVFHVGLSKTVGLSIGTAAILTGAVIIVIAVLLGEKLGIGTILNMLLIGIFLDMILALNVIPTSTSPLIGFPMMIVGLFIVSLATFFYIGSGFGAGPRDSLMVALTKKTGLSVGLCRGGIEIAAIIVGWWLGGMVGIGTVMSALLMGFLVQFTFRLLRFDATKIHHETIQATFLNLFKGTDKNQVAS